MTRLDWIFLFLLVAAIYSHLRSTLFSALFNTYINDGLTWNRQIVPAWSKFVEFDMFLHLLLFERTPTGCDLSSTGATLLNSLYDLAPCRLITFTGFLVVGGH